MKKKKVVVSLTLLAASLLIAYPLYAHCGNCAADGRKIATSLDHNKFTLAKAVTAAEEHSKGRAISAISELSEKGEPLLHVWCVVGEASNPPKIMKCFIDTKSGSVKGMKEVHELPTTTEHAHGEGHKGHGEHDGAMHDGMHGRHASAKTIANQTVEAACGACIFKMPGVTGCPLAIKIDGRAYLVEGATWPNHDYCDRQCQAVVSGKLEGDPPKFTATSFEPKE